MNIELLEKYLYDDKEAYYYCNGSKRCETVHYGRKKRFNKAEEQEKLENVDKNVIKDIIIDFLQKIGIKTTEEPEYLLNSIEDIEYKNIVKKYALDKGKENDLVWLKFTKDGYVGVVAVSNDINFSIPRNEKEYDLKQDYNTKKWKYNTSGIIIHYLGKEWDESFVFIFPLYTIPNGYKRSDIEKAIGNYLIEKNIPILDYYSHLY